MSRHELHIGTADGKDFSLPLELTTQSLAILAKKRVGKSYTAAVIAEELMAAGQQVAIVDPTGAHWGLRSSADGKAAGFPIVVFGGDHADLPLEDGSGEVLAKALVDQRFSAIIDVSSMRKGQATRFLIAFFETLYRLNRKPLQLICDEADAYAPQKPYGEEARVLGAMEDLVRRGGIRGIGTTLISQRPAILNKSVLTQCENLFALRLVHPLDIKAVMEWVRVQADEDTAAAMIKSLPSLPIGTAWFWSPGWMELFVKVKIRPRTTFDSGATPKPGQARVAPTVLAPIDVEKLGEEIRATAEKAKADDPKALRRQVSELEAELARVKALPAAPAVDLERERAELAWRENALRVMANVKDAAELVSVSISGLMAAVGEAGNQIQQPAAIANALTRATYKPNDVNTVRHELPRVTPAPRIPAAIAGDSTLTKAARLVLTALAQYPRGRTKAQVAILTGYAINGGGFNNALSSCRSRGYLDGVSERLTITSEGLAALGSYNPLPRGRALLEHWLVQCSKAERLVLEALAEAHPKGLTKEQCAFRAGYEPSGGGFNNALSRLRTLELISGRGELRLSDDFFE